MSLQLAYARHPDSAEKYREYLTQHGNEMGFSAKDIGEFENPVVIRELVHGEGDKKSLQVLVRQMNESFTQGMDPRTMQVAMGRKLTDQALSNLAEAMEEGETLNAFLGTPRAQRFVDSLYTAGIIDQRNANQYMNKGSRTLNEDGKTLVGRMLVGRTVKDADILSDTGGKAIESVARSVPALVQATKAGASYDLSGDLAIAMDALNDLQRRVDAGTIRPLDAKMSDKDLGKLHSYFEVLPGIGEPHPVLSNPMANTLLEVLIRRKGPVQMAGVFRDYAQTAAQNPEGQSTMFGAAVTPHDALRQALDRSLGRSEEKLAASLGTVADLRKAKTPESPAKLRKSKRRPTPYVAPPIDHTEALRAPDEQKYMEVRAKLKPYGYKPGDFDKPTGRLYGWSTNQLIDLLREKTT